MAETASDCLETNKAHEEFAFKQILYLLYGEKQIKILEFLIKNADENGVFHGTILEIQNALNVSKPCVIALFNKLKTKHLIKKEKNAYYKLHEKIFMQAK